MFLSSVSKFLIISYWILFCFSSFLLKNTANENETLHFLILCHDILIEFSEVIWVKNYKEVSAGINGIIICHFMIKMSFSAVLGPANFHVWRYHYTLSSSACWCSRGPTVQWTSQPGSCLEPYDKSYPEFNWMHWCPAGKTGFSDLSCDPEFDGKCKVWVMTVNLN